MTPPLLPTVPLNIVICSVRKGATACLRPVQSWGTQFCRQRCVPAPHRDACAAALPHRHAAQICSLAAMCNTECAADAARPQHAPLRGRWKEDPPARHFDFFFEACNRDDCVKLTASGLWICVSAVSGFPGSFKSRGARPSFPLTDTMPPKKSIKKAAPAKKEKRAPGPYMVFCKEMRPKIIKENPKLSFGEVGKALGAAWGKLSDAQKVKVRPAPARDDARAHAVGAPPVSRAY